MSDIEWIGTAEAAKRLGISQRAVQHRIKEGNLQARKDEGGKRWLVAMPILEEGAKTVAQSELIVVAGLEARLDERERLIERLEGEVEFLRQQLAVLTEHKAIIEVQPEPEEPKGWRQKLGDWIAGK